MNVNTYKQFNLLKLFKIQENYKRLPLMFEQKDKQQGETSLKLTQFFTNGVVLFVFAFLIVIFTLNAIFLEPLFQLGVNLIFQMQSGFKSKVFQVFMNIFSIICNTPVIAVIFLLQMGIAKHKYKALIHLSFFLLGFHIIAILKQAYQQSRPIWVSSEINTYEWLCPTDFGNPSGHSYVSFPLFEPLIVKYIGFEKLKIAWIFLIFFGIVVPFSRMYLGVHSINQVFFGFSFGLAWIVLFRYGLRKIFYQVFSRMLKLKKVSQLCIIIFIHIILTIIPVIIFAIRLKNTPLPDQDLKNLNRNCGTTITSDEIQAKMLGLCILHSPLFGFLYGFFALKCTAEDKLYFSGQWEYRNKISALLHCMAQLIIAGVIPLVVIVGFGSIWKEPYSQFFIFNLSIIVGSFLYIWLTPKLQRAYGWIKFDNEDKIVGMNDVQTRSSGQNLQINKNFKIDSNYEICLKKGEISL